MKKMYKGVISFITRLRENWKTYKNIVKTHLDTLRSDENFVSYNTQYAYIKRVECKLTPGFRAYAYLGLDLAMSSLESSKLFARASRDHMPNIDVHIAMNMHGVFVLISTRPFAVDNILPLYYTRQQIEQVFDICKYNINLLPLHIQTEDILRGHLLLTFTAAVLCKKFQENLKDTPYTLENALFSLRNHKCKVYDDHVLTMESTKRANEIYKKV